MVWGLHCSKFHLHKGSSALWRLAWSITLSLPSLWIGLTLCDRSSTAFIYKILAALRWSCEIEMWERWVYVVHNLHAGSLNIGIDWCTDVTQTAILRPRQNCPNSKAKYIPSPPLYWLTVQRAHHKRLPKAELPKIQELRSRHPNSETEHDASCPTTSEKQGNALSSLGV